MPALLRSNGLIESLVDRRAAVARLRRAGHLTSYIRG